jgi:predicted dehydrogenase
MQNATAVCLDTSCQVAIVGAGRIAREHTRAFRSIPGVKLVGIQSRTRARAESLAKEFGIDAVFESINELYTCTEADLVVVAVSELAMKETALDCMKYPWNILLEKPAGISVSEAEELFAVATARSRNDVAVAFNRQHYSVTQAVLTDLRHNNGLRHIRVLDQESRAAAKAHGYPDEVIAKWMYTNSVHLIDYFRMFARGKIAHIQNAIRWDPENPGAVLSIVHFDSGDVGVYEAVWDTPGPWAVSINIPDVHWEMRPLERGSLQHLGQDRTSIPVHERDLSFKPGFWLQAEKAVNACRGHQTDLPTLADSLFTMRLVERIYESPRVCHVQAPI